LLLVGAVTVVAAILRAIALDSQLWHDEIITLVDFVRKPLPLILKEYGKNNHPLNSVLAHGAVVWLGEHAWSLRLPAAVFGVACIPMVYVLGAMVGSAREGVLAAALLGASYHHVWFSQNARGYTALAFCALVCSVLLLRGMRDGRVRCPIAYGVVAALGVYAHLVMGFVILAHLLGWLWLMARCSDARARSNWWRPALGFGVAGVVTLMLYAPMIFQMYGAYQEPSLLRDVATPRWALRESLHALRVGFGSWGTVLSVALFAVGLWEYRRQKWLVVTLAVLPGALATLGVVVLRQPIQPRFLFFLIGFGALIVVRGAMVVGAWLVRGPVTRRVGATGLGMILVGLVILANVLSLGALYRHPKQDYVGAMRHVDTRRRIGDAVVTAGSAVRPYRDYYGKPWIEVQTVEDVQRIRAATRSVWMIYAMPDYIDRALITLIRRECRGSQVFQGTLAGGEVVACVL
jgi:mannosyltransferase